MQRDLHLVLKVSRQTQNQRSTQLQPHVKASAWIWAKLNGLQLKYWPSIKIFIVYQKYSSISYRLALLACVGESSPKIKFTLIEHWWRLRRILEVCQNQKKIPLTKGQSHKTKVWNKQKLSQTAILHVGKVFSTKELLLQLR